MENDNIFAELLRDLEESACSIVEQNRALITRLECRGFNPVKELDFTVNNAGVLIHRLFEAIAQFEEGKVPFSALTELCSTTDMLIDELKKRDDAPVCELDAAGVAFRKAALLWKDNHEKPRMKRKVYQRKHFKAEENINKALETLHAAYVKKYAAKGRKRKTLSAADMLEDDGKKSGERRVIFTEIERLASLGYSIAKAIEAMKSGSYGSRMRGVKSETWRRYYTEHLRRKTLRKRAKALGRDRVNETDDRVNDRVNGNNDRVSVPRDRVNSVDDRVNDRVKVSCDRVNDRVKNAEEGNQEGLGHCLYVKILQNPGKKSKELSLLVNKSVPTVSRYLKLLKAANQIEFRGAPKTGGYYVCAI